MLVTESRMAANEKGPPWPPKRSWADVLGSSLPTTWTKNVLEVILEKSEKGPFVVSELECVKLMTKIGLDTAGGLVEAVQICPNGRKPSL